MKCIHYTKSIYRAHKEILKLKMKPLRSSLFNWSLEAINVKFKGKNLFLSPVCISSFYYYSLLFNLDRDCRAVLGINFNPFSTPVSLLFIWLFRNACCCVCSLPGPVWLGWIWVAHRFAFIFWQESCVWNLLGFCLFLN